MKDDQQVKGLPPVWVFSIISSMRNFLKKLYYSFVPPSMAVFEKTQGFWIAKAISVACELNLAEIIGGKEKTVEEIARQSSTDADALYRLMRALASEGVFEETTTRMFKNNKFSNALTDQQDNLKYMIMHQLNPTNWEVVNELKYSVSSGNNAAQKLLGTDIFTHLQNSPEKNELYNKAMSETSRLSSAAIVSAYNFEGITTLADLGGGEGRLLYTILQKNPSMKGILLDQAHVVKTAAKLADNCGVTDRVKIVPGSFFELIPAGANAYILKNILHAFDDNTCITLLKSVYDELNPNGKILVIETVIKKDNKAAFGKILDLQMLLGTEKGKERTEEEFKYLFEEAGFKLTRIVKTISPFCIIEGLKT